MADDELPDDEKVSDEVEDPAEPSVAVEECPAKAAKKVIAKAVAPRRALPAKPAEED